MLEQNTAQTEHPLTHQTPRPKRAGLTMVETLLVLLVISGFIIGALAAFNAAQSSVRANNLQNDLTRAVAVIQRAAQFDGGYGADGTNLVPLLNRTAFAGSIVADTDATAGNDALVSPFSRSITFESDGAGLEMTYPASTFDECRTIVETFARTYDVQVGDTDMGHTPTVANIETACGATANGITVDF